MQSARDLVAVLVEFPAGVKLGHDDLGGGNPLLPMDIHRNPAAIVAHGDGAVRVNPYPHEIGMTGEGFVNAVVHDFIDHVVQARAVVRVADIHAGTLANGLQAPENLDGFCAVFFGLRNGLSHRGDTFDIAPDL